MNVVVENYHRFARGYLASRGKIGRNTICQPELKTHLIRLALNNIEPKQRQSPPIHKTPAFLEAEIEWIERQGIASLQDYLHTERAGRAASLDRSSRDFVYRQSDKSDVLRNVIGIAVGLYLAQGTPEARTLLKTFEQDVEKFHRELSQMVLAAGQQITPADGKEAERARAREIWDSVLDALLKRSHELHEQTPPRDFQAVVRVLDTLISRLFFSFDLIGTRAPDQNALDQEGRRVLFEELKSFIDRLVQADEIELDRDVPLIPHTAHYFLQLLNGILEFAPDDVLRYAFAICSRGARTGYLEDPMARAEAVKLVEKAIADFRDRLKQSSVATAVAGLLNLFTEHAWSEAVTLTFRLEEAFR
jgi:hypothetical protein